MTTKKEFTTKEPTQTPIPPCACKERDLLRQKGEQPEKVAALRGKCWAECWRCKASMGCPDCTPRPSLEEDLEEFCRMAVCRNCGAFTTGVSFIMGSHRLPREEFDRYPDGWRCEFWAVYGCPRQHYLPAIRRQLRIPVALKHINRVLRFEGWPEYTVDPITGEVE